MGCLKFLIKVAIVVLAIIGFKALGGVEFIKNLHFFEKPSQEELIAKSMDVADFSKIPDEYEIDRTANLLGYKGVLAEHKASGQKLAVLDPSKSALLTKKDFADGSIRKKLDGLNEKLAYQYIRLENFEITKQGKFHSMGQTIPYVKYTADVTNLPMKHIEGIIGVAEDDEKHSKILLSAAEGGKYSQIITEQFFNKVK